MKGIQSLVDRLLLREIRAVVGGWTSNSDDPKYWATDIDLTQRENDSDSTQPGFLTDYRFLGQYYIFHLTLTKCS